MSLIGILIMRVELEVYKVTLRTKGNRSGLWWPFFAVGLVQELKTLGSDAS